MGIIIGKLWRKKTTVEVLEKIDKEIKSIEEYRRNTEQTHKRIVGRFIVISVGIYLITAFLFYFYFFPATFYDRLFYIIPLIFAPVIILTVKRALTWYYKWKISRKQNKLVSLRDEKKKILDKVMETETYKVAKTILEKFALEPVIRKNSDLTSSSEFSTPVKQALIPTQPVTTITGGLRQRALPPPNQQMVSALTFTKPVATTASRAALKPDLTRTPMVQSSTTLPVMGTPLPMPRAILPRERSVFDKMVDYLVGDGPANRYALICKNCSSHNGMAFREEFEYISFRCCYCFTFNAARKKRPTAPKLEFEIKPLEPGNVSDTSGSEKNSPSDTDSETDSLLALKPSVSVDEQPKNDIDHAPDVKECEELPQDTTETIEEQEELKDTNVGAENVDEPVSNNDNTSKD